MAIEVKTIAEVLDRINADDDGGIFLPCIQRDFVWGKERIYKLLDSLMRGYPMGFIFIWETTYSINYRNFERDYDDNNNAFQIIDGNNSTLRQYILDGQQRLQSLYIAMHGSYNGNKLYFDLLGSTPDNGYFFTFTQIPLRGWVNVPVFLSKQIQSYDDVLKALEQSGITPTDYTADEMETMCDNAQRLYDVFKNECNIPIQKLNDNINLSDIAEIFTRVNSGGVVLTPEDFIMVAMTDDCIAENKRFKQLIAKIEGFGFNKPKDFIKQVCYAALLKETGNSQAIKEKFNKDAIKIELEKNYKDISETITDVLDFVEELKAVRQLTRIQHNPVFILAAYRYTHGRDAWNKNRDTARKFLLTALLCNDYLSRMNQTIIKALLNHVTSGRNRDFNIEGIQNIFNRRYNRNFTFDAVALLDKSIDMYSQTADIVLNLIYHGQNSFNSVTMTYKDHIFPQSELENKLTKKGDKRRYSDREINSILNCELLTEDRNSMAHKGHKLPDRYFSDTEIDFNKTRNTLDANDFISLDDFIGLHCIPRPNDTETDVWDIDNYRDFLDERKKLLIARMINTYNMLVG